MVGPVGFVTRGTVRRLLQSLTGVFLFGADVLNRFLKRSRSRLPILASSLWRVDIVKAFKESCQIENLIVGGLIANHLKDQPAFHGLSHDFRDVFARFRVVFFSCWFACQSLSSVSTGVTHAYHQQQGC